MTPADARREHPARDALAEPGGERLMFSTYYMARHGYVSPNKHTPEDVPVAVIPYEDREQVERLRVLYHVQRGTDTGQDATTDMQAALREFANPKPEEPTGLGAVVEDADGAHWVRRDAAPQWVKADAACFPQLWRSLDAVRVLSEGVQP